MLNWRDHPQWGLDEEILLKLEVSWLKTEGFLI